MTELLYQLPMVLYMSVAAGFQPLTISLQVRLPLLRPVRRPEGCHAATELGVVPDLPLGPCVWIWDSLKFKGRNVKMNRIDSYCIYIYDYN